MLYLLVAGISGAQHSMLCGAGSFVLHSVLLAVFGIPFWAICAAIFALIVQLFPLDKRGAPQVWLAVGAICAVVFFGGLIKAQFSPAHFTAGEPLPAACRTV
jgi:hypothetical protein